MCTRRIGSCTILFPVIFPLPKNEGRSVTVWYFKGSGPNFPLKSALTWYFRFYVDICTFRSIGAMELLNLKDFKYRQFLFKPRVLSYHCCICIHVYFPAHSDKWNKILHVERALPPICTNKGPLWDFFVFVFISA